MRSKEKELKRKIEEADRLYYVEDNPSITDQEYDKLRKEYEENFGDLNYVAGDIKPDFETITHPVKLLSLDKLFDDDIDIEAKMKAIYKRFGDFCLEPKIDGLTVVAYPKEDGSCCFATRGKGGVTGEVIPIFITKYSGKNMIDGDFAVRGEVFLTKSDFEAIVDIQREAGEAVFSNPRNAAAGILRNKEVSPYLNYLSFVVYEIPGSNLSTKEQLQLLKDKTQFTVIDNVTYRKSDDSLTFVRKYYNKIKNNDIPIDGVVIKPYSLEDSLKKFGVTGHHPNNAIAWKRSPDVYTTTIRKVTWQVGREKITPVAELDPVEIDGTTVSRATLHNLGFFKKLGLRRGDLLYICKSGEVIPKVLSVAERRGGFPIAMPLACPSCEGNLEIYTTEETADLRCTNLECTEKVVQNIAFLASKEVLDIKGLSEATARKIVQQFGSNSGEQVIFDLTMKDILKLPGFGKQSARNLYNSILKTLEKPISIPVLIKACCIPGIGGSVGIALEQRFKKIDTIREALDCFNMLKGVEGIGEKTAMILTSQRFKDKLQSVSELFIVEESKERTGSLMGTVWAITGKFPISRVKIETLIIENGGDVSNDVTRKVDYLLTSDVSSSSTKSTKAKELGIKIVTFDYLKEMISLKQK